MTWAYEHANLTDSQMTMLAMSMFHSKDAQRYHYLRVEERNFNTSVQKMYDDNLLTNTEGLEPSTFSTPNHDEHAPKKRHISPPTHGIIYFCMCYCEISDICIF